MSSTGRYFIRDHRSGRLFCVEPINRRNQKLDGQTWTNGGIDQVRGGAIPEEESIITPENGFGEITWLPPGTSPDGFKDMLLKREELGGQG
ncbi:hypothetical protein [Longimicrobium sp.]|jgi:hypothetical protein|uniref:hypothetical protein n=1 Tax=Longimicrobium sp. TaxID=2029185 RepID=UPI002F9522AE